MSDTYNAQRVEKPRHHNFNDLEGKRFARLLVESFAGYKQYKYGPKTTWNCICDCGNKTIVIGSNLGRKTTSCGCAVTERNRITSAKRKGIPRLNYRGENHPQWKGGKKDACGYVAIRKPEHPNARKSGYILEHVYTMSQHLGRPLLPNENVHHKNGIRDDNRIENLELWSRSQPPGQRVIDKIAWAKEILETYMKYQGD